MTGLQPATAQQSVHLTGGILIYSRPAQAVGGVRPEIMGIGPIAAVPQGAASMPAWQLGDIDLIELNEAFAAQSLAVIRELDFDEQITNVNGGAIALGHPLGCTGAKLTVQMLHELQRRGKQFGLVTMCIGGGMGAAGIIERLSRAVRIPV